MAKKHKKRGKHKKVRKSAKLKRVRKSAKLRKLFLPSKSRVSSFEIKRYSDKIKTVKKEISKVVIGQEKVMDSLIRALLCNSHVLVEGVPGIAKTLIIKMLGNVSGCDVGRVQFTVDLLPSDILGLTVYKGGKNKGFEVIKGPIFSNFLIADEINRSSPKTQSALLEGMQERQVTIGKKTYELPNPFFVMATQNPLEQAGVYELPEAQVDRFLFKILMGYPHKDEEKLILKNNIETNTLASFKAKKVISPKDILHMQSIVKRIYVNEKIESYIIRIVSATRESDKPHGKYIEWGASPRASIALYIASKAEALMQGRNYVLPQDIKAVAKDVLRHRIILGYAAEANGISSDDIIQKILDKTSVS